MLLSQCMIQPSNYGLVSFNALVICAIRFPLILSLSLIACHHWARNCCCQPSSIPPQILLRKIFMLDIPTVKALGWSSTFFGGNFLIWRAPFHPYDAYIWSAGFRVRTSDVVCSIYLRTWISIPNSDAGICERFGDPCGRTGPARGPRGECRMGCHQGGATAAGQHRRCRRSGHRQGTHHPHRQIRQHQVLETG